MRDHVHCCVCYGVIETMRKTTDFDSTGFETDPEPVEIKTAHQSRMMMTPAGPVVIDLPRPICEDCLAKVKDEEVI